MLSRLATASAMVSAWMFLETKSIKNIQKVCLVQNIRLFFRHYFVNSFRHHFAYSLYPNPAYIFPYNKTDTYHANVIVYYFHSENATFAGFTILITFPEKNKAILMEKQHTFYLIILNVSL